MEDLDKRRARLAQRAGSTVERFTGRTLSPEVTAAMAAVPRHLFLGSGMQPSAYDDIALPIGWRQTISQPSIVALMTQLLNPLPSHRILEVGTGSGYQAAVLSRLVSTVYSVETVPQLAERAARKLEELGFANVRVKCGDGRLGWPEHAPYDGIIVTAAAQAMPSRLPMQLKPNGKLVIPLAGHPFAQDLWVFEKQEDGRMEGRSVLAVSFVPLVGGG